MVRTRYTIPYRATGAACFGIALATLVLPWVVIASGSVGTYQQGDALTGWEMATMDKGTTTAPNPVGYLFMGALVLVLIAPLGLAFTLLGRSPRWPSHMLLYIAVFFLVLTLFLIPYFQGLINAPPDPFAGKEAQLAALQASDPDTYNQTITSLNALNRTRALALSLKELDFQPQYGLFLLVAMGAATFIIARLLEMDAKKVKEMERYKVLLVQSHRDGKITKDEAELLSKEREVLKISKYEHESMIREIFKEEAWQEAAIAQHERPVDVEAEHRGKVRESYRRALVQAHGDGKITSDERELLKVQRDSLGISEEEHRQILGELTADGKIRPAAAKREKDGEGEEEEEEAESAPAQQAAAAPKQAAPPAQPTPAAPAPPAAPPAAPSPVEALLGAALAASTPAPAPPHAPATPPSPPPPAAPAVPQTMSEVSRRGTASDNAAPARPAEPVAPPPAPVPPPAQAPATPPPAPPAPPPSPAPGAPPAADERKVRARCPKCTAAIEIVVRPGINEIVCASCGHRGKVTIK